MPTFFCVQHSLIAYMYSLINKQIIIKNLIMLQWFNLTEHKKLLVLRELNWLSMNFVLHLNKPIYFKKAPRLTQIKGK
jgi:hypothetical protein